MFRAMPDNKKNPKPRMLSVEETNAMLEKEFAEQNPKAEELPPKEGESKALDEAMQTSPSKAEKVEETLSEVNAMGSEKRPLHEAKGSYFPTDSLETDENTRKVRTNLLRDSEKRFQNGYPGGYCTVPVGTAAVPVLWVLQMGTAGYCGYCGYCTD